METVKYTEIDKNLSDPIKSYLFVLVKNFFF